jgi:hypothetical protein
MKTFSSFTILVSLIVSAAFAGGPATWTGEYADKKFLNGKGMFQLSLEQKGDEVSVTFCAVYSDGHGAAPDADGKGKLTAKGTVEFTWEDSFSNSGTGTIKKSGNDVVISIKPTHVADARCLQFYGDNIRLKPTGKK